MTQEELITYGFKRVVEELQKIQAQNQRQIELLEKIEHNTLVNSGEVIQANGYLKSIDNDMTITMSGVQEAKQIVKGIANHGGLEKQGL